MCSGASFDIKQGHISQYGGYYGGNLSLQVKENMVFKVSHELDINTEAD